MSILSLSCQSRKNFPQELGGHTIIPDFKNILRIMRLLADPECSEQIKMVKALEFFYETDYPDDPFNCMMDFVQRGAKDDVQPDSEPQMDFEFDADEIYCSFRSEYGIDLLETDMHWYKFLALLSGLSSESALTRKINLRTTSEEEMQGMKGKKRTEMLEAIASAQIPERARSIREVAEEKEFEDRWSQV